MKQIAQIGYKLTAPTRENTVSNSIASTANTYALKVIEACNSATASSIQISKYPSSTAQLAILGTVSDICNSVSESKIQSGLAKTAATNGDVVAGQEANYKVAKLSIEAIQGAKVVAAFLKNLKQMQMVQVTH